jgi:hypothetical protein
MFSTDDENDVLHMAIRTVVRPLPMLMNDCRSSFTPVPLSHTTHGSYRQPVHLSQFMDRDPQDDTACALVAPLSPVGTRHDNLSAPRASPSSTLAFDIAAIQYCEADDAYARACEAYESSFHPPHATSARYRAQPRCSPSSA